LIMIEDNLKYGCSNMEALIKTWTSMAALDYSRVVFKLINS